MHSILSQKFSNLEPTLSDEQIHLITEHTSSDVRRAEGLVKQLRFVYSQYGKYPDADEMRR